MDAELSLSEGNLEETLRQLQDNVRNHPSSVKYRVFLFQLLAVMGQWDRALTQLNLVGELDSSALAMVQTYREAILCEGLRREIFAGMRTPVVFGQPEKWIALLIDALRLTAEGQYARSQEIRNEAFELAPVTTGSIGDPQKQRFNWIADADARMGPVLEAIVNGRYYWVPFHRINTINIVEPEDMRDQVWMPAFFTWANGGEAAGLIPTRYSGSENSEDNQIRSAHKTTWQQFDSDLHLGQGQRMLATDLGEYSLMDMRLINFDSHEEETGETQAQRKSEITTADE